MKDDCSSGFENYSNRDNSPYEVKFGQC